MRIATWNVNSLKARIEKVTWWLDRARPDVLLMQETKLADRDAPIDVFRHAGYDLVHHGEGRWNGVAPVSKREREAFVGLYYGELVDAYRLCHSEPGRYTWWDYRAGNFHKNFGMRIDHLLVTAPLKSHIVWAEIDREARKGKPIPSDHAPLVIDIDEPGHPFDAGRASADERTAGCRTRPERELSDAGGET